MSYHSGRSKINTNNIVRTELGGTRTISGASQIKSAQKCGGEAEGGAGASAVKRYEFFDTGLQFSFRCYNLSMKVSSSKNSQLFLSLTEAIKTFLEEVNKHKLQDMATHEWTVKDELCHIAFWHDYYAQNYSSLVAGIKPYVFTSKGGSTRNQEGVDRLNHQSKKDLVTSLHKAHASLYKSIVVKRVPKMSYTDRKKYKTEEFLKEITAHIKRHTILVKRAKNFSN